MNKKLIIIILIVLVIVAAIALLFTQLTPTQNTQQEVTINYWGLWDDEQVMEPLFKEYQAQNPHVKIAYTKRKFGNVNTTLSYKGQYQATVDERLRDGTVDIVRVHNSWLPRILSNLSPAPQDIFSERTVKSDYYPAIYEAITTTRGEVYGAPMAIDGLVLLYNKDIFAREGITTPPTNWDQIVEVSKKVTKVQNGLITQAGINLGATSNTLHPFEIMLLMMTQSDVEVVSNQNNKLRASFATPEGLAAVNSYLAFTKTHNVWSPRLNNDLQSFIDGKLAMIIVPSWRAIDVVNANSKLNFDMAPVPVLPGANRDTPQYLASYWVDVVSKKSPNATEAWKLLGWLSKPEQLRKIYNEQKKVRLFGSPYPRTDMQNELKDTPYSKVIIEMAPRMKSWPLYDYGIWEETFKQSFTTFEGTRTLGQSDLEKIQQDLNTLIFDKQ